jgi:hypothetical protein
MDDGSGMDGGDGYRIRLFQWLRKKGEDKQTMWKLSVRFPPRRGVDFNLTKFPAKKRGRIQLDKSFPPSGGGRSANHPLFNEPWTMVMVMSMPV